MPNEEAHVIIELVRSKIIQKRKTIENHTRHLAVTYVKFKHTMINLTFLLKSFKFLLLLIG